jgi:maleamate amidohydrolase
MEAAMTEAVPATQNDAEFFAQRGFGQRIGFGERPALIIIDMLKAFTDEEAMLGANLDKEIEAIIPLLAVAHDRSIPVIFSTVRYEDADLKDAGIWAVKMKGTATLKADGQGWEIDPRLEFRRTDTLLFKKYASCFFGTDLVPRLLAHRVDTLVITGCTTSGCVRATSVDACQNGFRPMVVREAVGDRAAAAHAQSLFDLDAKYADVVSQRDALAYLQRVGHNSPLRT